MICHFSIVSICLLFLDDCMATGVDDCFIIVLHSTMNRCFLCNIFCCILLSLTFLFFYPYEPSFTTRLQPPFPFFVFS